MGIFVQHLTPPTKTGLRTFRRRFPPELRELIGRWELKVPLGREGAEGFWAAYETALSDYDKMVAVAQQKLEGRYDTLDGPLIAYLVEVHRVQALEGDNAARWGAEERELFKSVVADLEARGVAHSNPWKGREAQRWAAKRRETVEWLLPHYRALRANGDLEGIIQFWRDDALELADAKGYVIDPESEGFGQLCRALNDVGISILEDVAARLEGHEAPTPPEPAPPVAGSASKPFQSRVPMLATFDAYATAQEVSAGVRAEWRHYIELLIEFVGHDDAALLTSQTLRDWREKLLNEPTRRGKPRKPVTVRDKYLTSVRAMLQWAVEEQKLPANVANEVKVRVPKQARLRDPDFTLDEAKSILKATLVPVSGRLSPGYARARRWIPWLCAYTGARVNEFSQLRGQDVMEVEGIWCVQITPDAGTVKDKKFRDVPLHQHIIDQGFLEVVKAVGDSPLFYDPGKRRVDSESNRHIKKVGERLAAWVREDVGVNDPAIQPNHAWRHTFKTLSYTAGIEERVADAIQGHAHKTTGRRYGKPTVQVKAEAIAKLPRFEVPGA
jgi:integrase